jgi:hypothetical protein
VAASWLSRPKTALRSARRRSPGASQWHDCTPCTRLAADLGAWVCSSAVDAPMRLLLTVARWFDHFISGHFVIGGSPSPTSSHIP